MKQQYNQRKVKDQKLKQHNTFLEKKTWGHNY